MNRKSVSAVIPAYNAAKTIGRAIDSLLAQAVPPDEILVVDDGSSDQLESALKTYRSKVTYLPKPNGGAASARNHGIDRSQGEFIAFLDADDCWEPSKLQRQLEILNRYPEVGLIASRFYTQEPGAARSEPSRRPDHLLDRVIAASGGVLFELAMLVLTSTVVIRRTALGDFRFESGLEPAEDRDLWIRLLHSHPGYVIADPLATVILEPGSLSRSDPDRDYSPMIHVLGKFARLLDHRGLSHFEARVFRGWAASHLANGRPQAAIAPALRRLVRQPSSLEGWWVLLKSAWLATACSVFQRTDKLSRAHVPGSPAMENELQSIDGTSAATPSFDAPLE